MTSQILVGIALATLLSVFGCGATSAPDLPQPIEEAEQLQQALGSGSLRVYVRDEAQNEANMSKPRIYLVNGTNQTFSNFKLQYYFTIDAGRTPVLEDYYTPNSTAVMQFVQSNIWRVHYDFAGISLAPGQSTDSNTPPDGNVVGLHYSNFSAWNRVDDWSHTGVGSTFTETTKVPVLDASGNLVHGSAPPGVVLPLPPTPPPGPQRLWFQVSVPQSLQVNQVGLGAGNELRVNDGATVLNSAQNGKVPVTNSGLGLTDIGAGARTASVFGGGAVTIRGSQVFGDVTATGSLAVSQGSQITGTTYPAGTVFGRRTVSWSAVLPSSIGTIPSGNNKVLTPGRWAALHPTNGQTVQFSQPGVYYIESLQVDTGATLSFSNSTGPILVYVEKAPFVFQGAISKSNASAYNIQFSFAGTGTVALNAPFTGTLVAPNAKIDLGVCPFGQSHKGSFFGRNVELRGSTTVVHKPLVLDCAQEAAQCRSSLGCQLPDADGDLLTDCEENGDGSPWTSATKPNGIRTRWDDECVPPTGNVCTLIDTLSEIQACTSQVADEAKVMVGGWSWPLPTNTNLCDPSYGFTPNWTQCPANRTVTAKGFLQVKEAGKQCFKLKGIDANTCGALYVGGETQGLLSGQATRCYELPKGRVPIQWTRAAAPGVLGTFEVLYCSGGSADCEPGGPISPDFLRADDCGADECSDVCPCNTGDGTCQTAADCAAGLVCPPNNGPLFHKPTGTSVCVPPEWPEDPLGDDHYVPSVSCDTNADCPSYELCTEVQENYGYTEPVKICINPTACSGTGASQFCGRLGAPCGLCECTPNCVGKQCGDEDLGDDCGGYCEGLCAVGDQGCRWDIECSSGARCSSSGKCLDPTCFDPETCDPASCGDTCSPSCIKACDQQECGPDTRCNVDCGPCEAGESCDGGICMGPLDDRELPEALVDEAPTVAVGALAGAFSVGDSGRAEYSLTFDLPTSRGGSRPRLGVAYSGGTEPGDAGVGWNIIGTSKIGRCAKTAATDGWPSPPVGAADDAFCIDGQRLIPVQQPSSDETTEYRTEIDSFNKITYHRTAAGGATGDFDYWSVQHKEGGTSYYGRLNLVPSETMDLTRDWLLTERVDRSGLWTRYRYHKWASDDCEAEPDRDRRSESGEEAPGQPVFLRPCAKSLAALETVNYGGDKRQWGRHSVKFLNSLPDLLFNVKVTYGSETIRQYHFASRSVFGRPNFIKSIEECVLSGEPGGEEGALVCKPKTEFSYVGDDFDQTSLNLPAQFVSESRHDLGDVGAYATCDGSSEASCPNTARGTELLIDANADGLLDLLYAHDTWPEARRRWHIAPGLESDGSFGFGESADSVANVPSEETNRMVPKKACFGAAGVVDLNGDARTDLVDGCAGNAKVSVWMATGQGEAISYDTIVLNLDAQPGDRVFPLDVEGDGYHELLVCSANELRINRWPSDAFGSGQPAVDVVELPGPVGCDWQVNDRPEASPLILDADGDGVGNLVVRYLDKAYSLVGPDYHWVDTGIGTRSIAFAPAQNGSYKAGYGAIKVLDSDGERVAELLEHNAMVTTTTGRYTTVTTNDFSRAYLWNHDLFGPWEPIQFIKPEIGFKRAAFDAATVADPDMDGVDDLIGFLKVDGAWKFTYASRGTSDYPYWEKRSFDFRTSTDATLDKSEAKDGISPPLFADFDGDGALDVLTRSQDGNNENSAQRFFYQGSRPARFRLREVVDGLGNTIRVSYDANGTAYEKGDCTSQAMCLTSVGPIVEKVARASNSGTESITQYSYTGARVGRWGRGWLGFQAISARLYVPTGAEEDGSLPIAMQRRTTRYFDQSFVQEVDGVELRDYPYARMPASVWEDTAPTPSGIPDAGETAGLARFRRETATFFHSRLSDAGRPLVQVGTVQSMLSQKRDEDVDYHVLQISTKSAGDEGRTIDEFGNVLQLLSDVQDASGAVVKSFQIDRQFVPADLDNWEIAQLEQERVRDNYDTLKLRLRNYDYYNNGLLKSVTRGKAQAQAERTTTFTYDESGNVTTTETSAPGQETKTNVVIYDGEGLRIQRVVDPSGLETQVEQDEATGLVKSQMDPNGVVTRYAYDRFGQNTIVETPTGRMVTRAEVASPMGAAVGGIFDITEMVSDNTSSRTTTKSFDSLGRIRRVVTTGLAGATVQQVFSYTHEEDGFRASATVAHPVEQLDAAVIESKYDILGNLRSVAGPTPAGTRGTTSYDYGTSLTAGELEDGQSFASVVRVIDADGIAELRFADVLGRPIRTQRGDQQTDVVYGAFDQISDHMAVSGSEEITYDAYDRVLSVSDGDLGTITTEYDGFDRPRTITRADDTVQTVAYDVLDRVKTITNAAGVQRFFYDHDELAEQEGEPPTQNSLGKLVRTQNDTPDGVVERVLRYEAKSGDTATIDLDNRGLLESVTVVAESEELETKFEYATGTAKLVLQSYPDVGAGAFQVRHCYDVFGVEVSITNGAPCEGADSEDVYWHQTSALQGMAVDGFKLGNGVSTDLTLDPDTFALLGIDVGMAGAWATSLTYQYEPGGRLHGQTRSAVNSSFGFTRQYDYAASGILDSVLGTQPDQDELEVYADPMFDADLRLQDVDRGQGQPSLGQFVYDPRSDGTGPSNRPSSVGPNTFQYDGRGNQVFRDGPAIAGGHQEIDYNDFNLPRRIRTGAGGAQRTNEFQYDASAVRAFTGTDVSATWHLDELYEKEIRDAEEGFEEVHRYYVFAGGERIAQITRVSNDSDPEFTEAVQYLHHDHLGTLIAVTDRDGALVGEFDYDLFGEPKQSMLVAYGYTDYRHEQDLGLIDARGRFYDPQFGFFLSADIVGPLSGSSPRGNRYAYVGYDPINYVDPTGHIIGLDDIAIVALGVTCGPVCMAVAGGIIIGATIVSIAAARGAFAGGGEAAPPPAYPTRIGGDRVIGAGPADPPTLPDVDTSGARTFGRANAAGVGATSSVNTNAFGSLGPDAARYDASSDGWIGRGFAGSETWVNRQDLTPEQREAMDSGDEAVGTFLFTEFLWGRVLRWVLPVARAACFAEGTSVHTENGLKAIEDVRVGDLVWARDEQSGEVALRRVVRTFVTADQELLELVLKGADDESEALRVTGEHPFWTRGRGWSPAGELRIGDEVLRRSGDWLVVTDTNRLGELETVYNFEVEGFHTYFVGEQGAWVHNTCVDVARALASKLPGSLKCFGRCSEFASALQTGLQKAGVSGIRIEIQVGKGITPYSDAVGALAERGGGHFAVRVGDTVFDNLRPSGIPYQQFIDDLGGAAFFDTPFVKVIETAF